MVDACLDAGWDAVLFDGSALPRSENIARTRAIVERAHALGASVEGELVSIRGHEVGVATLADDAQRATLEDDLAFIEATGIDCYAPSIGNVHGRTSAPPHIDLDRASALAAATPIPLALHGGTGLPEDMMRALIATGCCKVNISTALREAATSAMDVALPSAGDDPLPVLVAVRDAVRLVARDAFRLLGSLGRA